MAPHSRNRRAGELLVQGVTRDQIAPLIGGTAEAIGSVPLLAALCEHERVSAPATQALAALVEGRIAPESWIQGVRAGDRRAA
jgi:glycerol-3-phosphate dehydrogenase (NAD(P)+)